MMDVTPLIKRDAQVIQGYGPGFIRVSGETHTHPILITPDATKPWSGQMYELPTLAVTGEVEILLIGVAAISPRIPPQVREQLKRKFIGLEVMDTGSACRTYNVLLAEGRRVMAALLPKGIDTPSE